MGSGIGDPVRAGDMKHYIALMTNRMFGTPNMFRTLTRDSDEEALQEAGRLASSAPDQGSHGVRVVAVYEARRVRRSS